MARISTALTLMLFGMLPAGMPALGDEPVPVAAPVPDSESARWVSLFNGKNLNGWKVTQFGGQGEVAVEKGRLVLNFGANMTGVTATKELMKKIPRIDYEVRLDAMRADGTDFFCGLTFPVKKDPCSLIVGGWGGGVCGLSSIDGYDASENETTTYMRFEKGRWYDIRLQVTGARIRAWIDDKEIVDQDIRDRELSIRAEVELSKPFGIATWQTRGVLKNIRVRKLTDGEVAKTKVRD